MSLPNPGSELRHADWSVRLAAMDGDQRIVKLISVLTAQLGLPEHEAVADAIVSTMALAVMLSRLALDPLAVATIGDCARACIDTLIGSGSIVAVHTKA